MLADGEVLAISDASELYEELWMIATEQRGAVAAATKLLHARAYSFRQDPQRFDKLETEALRAALRRLARRQAR